MQGGVGGMEQMEEKKPDGHGVQDARVASESLLLMLLLLLLLELAQPGQQPHWQIQIKDDVEGGGDDGVPEDGMDELGCKDVAGGLSDEGCEDEVGTGAAVVVGAGAAVVVT